MKKIFYVLAISLCCVSCSTKTPEQAAEESFQKDLQEQTEAKEAHEEEIDELVNIATGLSVEPYETSKRRHALNKLRKEYPEMSDKWDKVEESIDNMEMY